MAAAFAAEASEAEPLIELVRQLAEVSSHAQIAANVTRAIRTLTGADGATFVLKEGECCYYAHEDAAAPLWTGQRFPLNECISGWAMNHRATVVIPDVRADPRIPQGAYRPTFVHSLVVAPVRTDAPIAAIGAYWARPAQPHRREVATVEAIAHAAALALQNLDLMNSLRAAAAAKSRLLTAVSHDLRQPMQSLALFASVLEIEAKTPAASQAANQLAAAVDRMANLLGSIMALADLDAGGVKTVCRPVDVDTLLAPLAAEMTAEAEAKGIRLVRVPCSARVTTDAGLMTAILRNLVANAIRYTDHGKVVIGARRHHGDILLVVGDSGIGIDPTQQATIFEEFYQVDNPGRDFSAGTGVGLALVRRLVDALGHRIRLHSVKGRGSLFTVALPAA